MCVEYAYGDVKTATWLCMCAGYGGEIEWRCQVRYFIYMALHTDLMTNLALSTESNIGLEMYFIGCVRRRVETHFLDSFLPLEKYLPFSP